MLVGPVFTRELVTSPRRPRTFLARAVYVGTLLMVVATAWMLASGTQVVRNVGDVARFGEMTLQLLAPLQLVLAMFFAAMQTAVAVAQEKDRRTLILLLMTRLNNSEIVLGKLLASMLGTLAMLLAAIPLFMLLSLFGGISFQQIAQVFVVTISSALVAGSLGSTIALWREKTFQTLALTALALLFWVGAWEVIASGSFGTQLAGAPIEAWAAGISPWRAIVQATRPFAADDLVLPGIGSAANLNLLVNAGLCLLLCGIAVARVRIWNPSREARPRLAEEKWELAADGGGTADTLMSHAAHAAPGKSKTVWNNPILWREICTWAYGRKIVAVRIAYLLLFAMSAAWTLLSASSGSSRMDLAMSMAPLLALSLTLINALAVTSITTERDLGAFDLLLVTDLTPQEFVLGKLWGVFYVAREMILLPVALCLFLAIRGAMSWEVVLYLIVGILLLVVFAAVLGIHLGMTYVNSRTAVAASLGTVFFLLVGVAVCMRIMISFSGSFQLQLAPFLAFMVGGGVGLFVALGSRNPSAAIGWASFLCPVLTFVAITGFLQGDTLSVLLVLLFTYGLTTLAMLIPAIYEFDVATGRTTAGEG